MSAKKIRIAFFLFFCSATVLFSQRIEPSFLTELFSRNRSAPVKTVTASSGQNTAAAVDGDLATCWKADTNEVQWIQVELQEVTTVRSVYTAWTADAPAEGRVEVSMDGIDWKTTGSLNEGFREVAYTVSCTPAEAKHVRMVFEKRYAGKDAWKTLGYMLRELAVNPELSEFWAKHKEPAKKVYRDPAAEQRAEAMLAKMSLEQKIRYIGGTKHMYTQAYPEIGLPSLRMTDASMGIKHFPNTAFPATILLAAAWNRDLAALQGETIASACRHHGIHVLLGPGVNLYRDSRNGRNYEYMGEDPYLAGQLAVAYIRAMQSRGIIATVKHFAANNIEKRRLFNNSVISERALRELYFPAFRMAVQEGGVKAIMTAYNLLNGTYCAEDPWLIKEVLEGEWGFDGISMSDWWSTYDPVMCFNSGLDLEMPDSRAMNFEMIQALLEGGVLSEAELDDKVKTILYTGYSTGALDRPEGDTSFPAGTEEHARFAERIAEEGIVLLKNRPGFLPLAAEQVKKVILAGPAVKNTPRSGTGSGSVGYQKGAEPPRSILKAFTEALGADRVIGCATAKEFNALSEAELAEADLVIACVGFNTDKDAGFGEMIREGENFDRDFALPPEQNELIRRCAAANPNTVVAVSAGGGVEMSGWEDQAGAILHTWYTGSAGARPLQKIVFGEVNPSGRLPITIERKWEDSPVAHAAESTDTRWIGGRQLLDTNYDEDVLVGYRWYDTKKLPVSYPFGHGLSYTTYEYSKLTLDRKGSEVVVSADVKNTGSRAGKETVQVYVHDSKASVVRPERELKGFAKVELAPGESKRVSITLNKEAFMYFCPEKTQWVLEPGVFEIQVGASSRDIRLKKEVSFDRRKYVSKSCTCSWSKRVFCYGRCRTKTECRFNFDG